MRSHESFLRLVPCFVLTLFLGVGCQQERGKNLRYLDVNEAIQHFHRTPFIMADEVSFTLANQQLSDQELATTDVATYGYDYGLNDAGEVAAIHLKEKRYEDNILKIILAEYAEKPHFLNILPMRYDCDSLGPLLDLIFDSDQGIYNPRIDYTQGLSQVNQDRAFPILTSCNFTALTEYTERQRAALFLVIQHAQKELICFYYPYFVRATEAGVFDPSDLALVTDRLLLYYGYPQVFGSQMDGESRQVNDLMFPDKVDSLRAEMNLQPLADYLKHLREFYEDRGS